MTLHGWTPLAGPNGRPRVPATLHLDIVLDELTTLIRRNHTHERASATLDRPRQSDSLTLIHPSEADFEVACVQFARYDDHAISFTDHMTGVLAIDRDIEYLFAFDGDFRTLGLTLVPADTGDV